MLSAECAGVACTNSTVDTMLAKLVEAGRPVLWLGRRPTSRRKFCPAVAGSGFGTYHAMANGRQFD